MNDTSGQQGVSSAKRLDALVDFFLEQVRRGERPSISEYAKGNPELAKKILDLFPALAYLEEAQQESSGEVNTVACSAGDGIAVKSTLQKLGEFHLLSAGFHKSL